MKKIIAIYLLCIHLLIIPSTNGIHLYLPNTFQEHFTTDPTISHAIIQTKAIALKLINAILDKNKNLANQQFAELYTIMFQQTEPFMQLKVTMAQAHEQDIISILGIIETAIHLYQETFPQTHSIPLKFKELQYEYSFNILLEETLAAGVTKRNDYYKKAKTAYDNITTPTTWDRIKSSLKFSIEVAARYNIPGLCMYFVPNQVANQIAADNEFYGHNNWPNWGNLLEDISYYAINWFNKKTLASKKIVPNNIHSDIVTGHESNETKEIKPSDISLNENKLQILQEEQLERHAIEKEQKIDIKNMRLETKPTHIT